MLIGKKCCFGVWPLTEKGRGLYMFCVAGWCVLWCACRAECWTPAVCIPTWRAYSPPTSSWSSLPILPLPNFGSLDQWNTLHLRWSRLYLDEVRLWPVNDGSYVWRCRSHLTTERYFAIVTHTIKMYTAHIAGRVARNCLALISNTKRPAHANKTV